MKNGYELGWLATIYGQVHMNQWLPVSLCHANLFDQLGRDAQSGKIRVVVVTRYHILKSNWVVGVNPSVS